MTRRALAVAALALGGSLALSGCGAVNPMSDTCQLLDRASIEDITGVHMLRGEFDNDISTDTVSVCAWRPPGGGLPVVQVYVTGGADHLAQERDEAEKQSGSTKTVTVDGASEAFETGAGDFLGMTIGEYYVQVAYIGASGADIAATTLALAEHVAGKIG